VSSVDIAFAVLVIFNRTYLLDAWLEQYYICGNINIKQFLRIMETNSFDMV